MKAQRVAIAVVLSIALTGCSSIGAVTGAVTGAAAGGGSANPAVGYAVGIGSKAATDALVKYLSRKRHEREQDVLAEVAGNLGEGETAPWAIRHKIPLFDDEHGRVTLIRNIPNGLAPCKEVVFVILGGKQEHALGYYTTAVCQGPQGWRWAQAEPSTSRWGSLQ